MKRLAMIMVMISCLITEISAQDRFIDHLAVGINYGTTSMKAKTHWGYLPFGRHTDGVGLEVAAQILDWMDVRAGISTTVGWTKSSGSFSVEGVPDGKYVTGTVAVSRRYSTMAGSLFFDFYPFSGTTFHFTAGFYAGTSAILKVSGTTPVPEALASYDKGVMEMYGLAIPTDRNGMIEAKLRQSPVRPYVGIGIGRAFSRRVNVTADFGAMYKGRNGMTIEGPDGNDVEVAYWLSNSYMSRMVSWNKRCAVAPLLSVRLFVKIF